MHTNSFLLLLFVFSAEELIVTGNWSVINLTEIASYMIKLRLEKGVRFDIPP